MLSWWLFRIYPGEAVSSLIASLPDEKRVRSFMVQEAGERKLVERQTPSGLHFLVKSHATTLQAILRATKYYAILAEHRPPAPLYKKPEIVMPKPQVKTHPTRII